MQRWEYTCCSVTEASLNYTDLINHLNKLGLEGWELVGVSAPQATSEGILAHSINNKLTYWLKRPKDLA
jgi:hypothetical protein